MSYEKNTSLIVTGYNYNHLLKIRKKLIELFKLTFKDEDNLDNCTNIITKIHSGLANSQYSFAVLPDGSKEGWSTSDAVDNAINKLLTWINENKDIYCEYVYIAFSGDDNDYDIKTDKQYNLVKRNYLN
jgi:hypothetical protein